MPKVTIKTIAQMAGVSPSTVSIVLNDRPGVSESTREKVRQIIQANHYVPNPNSRRLLFNKSDNITVLLNKNQGELHSQFYVELNNEIVSECSKIGYNLVYAFYDLTANNESVMPPIIEHRDTGGVIFLGDPPMPVQQTMTSYDIPFVISDAHVLQTDIPSVYTDYNQEAYVATKYLIDNGHRDIGYLGYDSPKYLETTLWGFQSALRDGGCLYHPEWMLSSPNSDKISYERSRRWEQTGKLPSAIFCTGDLIAIGCMRYFQHKGFDIPRDISLISIDDMLISEYVTPGLTTVHINNQNLAQASMALLLDRISGKNKLPEHLLVPHGDIVERSSVCPYTLRE